MKTLLLILILLAFSPATINAQESATASQKFVTLRGRVVDARTGEPFAKVRVIASGTDQTATTDDNGAFTLERLPVFSWLYASARKIVRGIGAEMQKVGDRGLADVK